MIYATLPGKKKEGQSLPQGQNRLSMQPSRTAISYFDSFIIQLHFVLDASWQRQMLSNTVFKLL